MMRRKRRMYRKIGAPVDKVLDFLADLRSRMPEKREQESITCALPRDSCGTVVVVAPLGAGDPPGGCPQQPWPVVKDDRR